MVFTAAGCATASLWRDNRTHEYEAVPGARAFRWPSDAHAFVVALDEPAVAKLRSGAQDAAASAWLDVRLPAQAGSESVFDRPRLELWLVHEEGAPAAWFLGERARPQKLTPPSSPTRVPCLVTALPAEPMTLGDAIEHVQVVDVVVRDDGTPFVVRVVATPLTVALDGAFGVIGVAGVAVAIVLSPIGLVLKGIEHACEDGDR